MQAFLLGLAALTVVWMAPQFYFDSLLKRQLWNRLIFLARHCLGDSPGNDPDSRNLRTMLALFHAALNKPDEAKELLRGVETTNIHPEYASYYRRAMGWVCARHLDAEGMISVLETVDPEALQGDDLPDYLLQLATAHLYKEEFALAQEVLQKLENLTMPPSYRAWLEYLRGFVSVEFHQNHGEALSCATRTVEAVGPTDFYAKLGYQLYAQTLIEIEHDPGEMAWLLNQLAPHFGDMPPHEQARIEYIRAKHLMGLGKLDEARKHVEEAMALPSLPVLRGKVEKVKRQLEAVTGEAGGGAEK